MSCHPAPSDRAAKRDRAPQPLNRRPRPTTRQSGAIARHSGRRSGTQGTGAATTTTIIPRQHPPTVLPHPDAVPTVGPGRRTRPHHSHVTTTTNPLSPTPSYRTPMRYPRWGPGGAHARTTHTSLPPQTPSPPNRLTAPRCGTHGGARAAHTPAPLTRHYHHKPPLPHTVIPDPDRGPIRHSRQNGNLRGRG